MGSSGSKKRISDRSQVLVVYDKCRAREAVAHTKSDFVQPECLVNHLRVGDLIQKKGNYVYQWFYSHFAVYIGNGEVAHVAKGSFNDYYVKRERMVDAFAGQLVRKNNHLDNARHFQVKSYRDIVKTVREWVDMPWNYKLLSNNCEHFASLCRYGRSVSLQCGGILDVMAGNIGLRELVHHSVRSVAEKCDTFTSWVNRKVLGFFAEVNGLLGIGWH